MSIIRPFIAIPKDLSEWDRFFRDATVGDNEITNEKLRDSVGTSVIGRRFNSTGDPGDIQSLNDNEFLVRRSSVLGFDTLADSDIPDTIKRVWTVQTLTSDTNVLGNTINLVDTTSGAVSVTLPTATSGVGVHVKKISGNNPVTVIGIIDAYTSIVINLIYESFHLKADGSQWYII